MFPWRNFHGWPSVVLYSSPMDFLFVSSVKTFTDFTPQWIYYISRQWVYSMFPQRNFHGLPLVVLYSSQWIWSVFPQWKLSRILFLNELITYLVSQFIPCYSEKFSSITFSGSLFIPVDLFHVSSMKFSWISLNDSFFIPSGFLPCFLNENLHRFLFPNEFITFLVSEFIPCFLKESFMDYPQWFFIYP